MTTLTVDMGGISYRASLPTPADALALAQAVHDALTALGLEPWVRATGMCRDQWGALRPEGAAK